MEFYSAIKKNKIMSFAGTWTEENYAKDVLPYMLKLGRDWNTGETSEPLVE